MRIVGGVSVPERGDVCTLVTGSQGEFVDFVTIVSMVDGNRFADVEFKSGAQLRVQMTLLGQVPTHHRHRAHDMDTARAAAQQTSSGLTDQQIKVLQALANAGEVGMLDHDHERMNGVGQTSAGRRRLELQRMGLVIDAGTRRSTGKAKAAVWKITPAGRSVYEQLRKQGRIY